VSASGLSDEDLDALASIFAEAALAQLLAEAERPIEPVAEAAP